jgi:hypothetical protein
VLNTKPERLRESCGHFAKPGEAVVLSPMAGRLKLRCFESLSQPAELNRGERTRD